MADTEQTYVERRLASMTTGAMAGELIRAQRRLPARYLPRDAAARVTYFHKLADRMLQQTLLTPERASTALVNAIRHAHSLVAPAATVTYPENCTLEQASAADLAGLSAGILTSKQYQERQAGHESRAAILQIAGLEEQLRDLRRIVEMLQSNGQASRSN